MGVPIAVVRRRDLQAQDLVHADFVHLQVVRGDERVEVAAEQFLSDGNIDTLHQHIGLGANDVCSDEGVHRLRNVVCELRSTRCLLEGSRLRHRFVQIATEVGRRREALLCRGGPLHVMQAVFSRAPILGHSLGEHRRQKLDHKATDDVCGLIATEAAGQRQEVCRDLLSERRQHFVSIRLQVLTSEAGQLPLEVLHAHGFRVHRTEDN
mmetsp:Transcript_71127/g.203889  ORF Transcript_71127/g.203889 Transcript_71127/m.203889 type:complete len:209 (-) Transcript_71127:612-1238(-)